MQQVKISERALEARIKRAMAKDGHALKRCRQDSPHHGSLGDHYIVDLNTNSIAAQHIDLEALGREMGLLKPFEAVEA